jgi:hypothetical protein
MWDHHVDNTRMLAARGYDKKIFDILSSYAPNKREKNELSFSVAVIIIELERQRNEAHQRNVERTLARL